MKHKLFTLTIIMSLCNIVMAQNIQIHYDFGHNLYKNLSNRQNITTTLEMFKADKCGTTFIMADLDFDNEGMMGTYVEIEREFFLHKKRRWALHLEYSGGLTTGRVSDSYWGERFQHAALAGIAWNWISSDFTKMFSVIGQYRYQFKRSQGNLRPFHSFQMTTVWGITFAKGFCSFNGFLDFWHDPTAKGKMVFTSEPQFWFNANAFKGWEAIKLSVGTEVKLSQHLYYNKWGSRDDFYTIPTLALKWTFD